MRTRTPSRLAAEGVPDIAPAARANSAQGNRAGAAQAASNPLQRSRRMQAQQAQITTLFGSTAPPIQAYTESADRLYNVSQNNAFAISKAAYPKAILTARAAPADLPGGLKWNAGGAVQVDGRPYTRYEADISGYEEREGPGSAKFCGQFARGLTGALPEEEQSTGDPGGVLYDEDTSPRRETGWENHYAAVVMVDGEDHATFETAVGIDHVWAGIYGTQRGQTFKYKTQEANIERLMNMPDVIIPARTRLERGFWDWVFCRPGRRVVTKEEVRVPQGVTREEGEQWQREMQAWRDTGAQPASDYMQGVVLKLEAELQKINEG